MNISTLRIFVSGPSDVEEELSTVRLVVEELNCIPSKILKMRFEVYSWNVNVYPSAANDSQSVINQQIDNYDVYLGVLWSRIGSPTPRYASGTLEEFERAYNKYVENPDVMELMVYFKDAPVSPSMIDPDQLKLLADFKSSLKKRGVLYKQIEDSLGFERALRIHLMLLATSRSESLKTIDEGSETIIADSPSSASTLGIDNEYNDGVLEKVREYGHYMNNFKSIMDELSQGLNDLGLVSRECTSVVTDTNRTTQEAVRAFESVRDSMTSYSRLLIEKLSLLRTIRLNGFMVLGNALAEMICSRNNVSIEFLDDTETQLRSFYKSGKTTTHTLTEFQDVILLIPNAIDGFHEAKNGLVDSMANVIEELNNFSLDARSIADTITRFT